MRVIVKANSLKTFLHTQIERPDRDMKREVERDIDADARNCVALGRRCRGKQI